MPTIDHKYKTSYAFAQDLVQLYAPLTQRCLLPSYRKPDITVKISSTCDPDFAALMKSVCAKLDLTDQAQFSDEECRLFRYYRMHGPHKLYRTGLSGQHLFASQRYHQERLFMLMYSLANLLGEKILSRLRIPVIPATQSGAKLPPNPKEACHPIRTKAAPHRSPIGAQRRLSCSGYVAGMSVFTGACRLRIESP